jgi:hypothetical protein
MLVSTNQFLFPVFTSMLLSLCQGSRFGSLNFFLFSKFQVYVGLYCAGYFDFVRRTLLINLINTIASSNNTVGILRRHFLICHWGFILSVV